jgi:predicted transcriptional regulator
MRRDKEEIIREILETVLEDSQGISRLMMRVGLTTFQINDYLKFLLSNNLLDIVAQKSGNLQYKITPRGVQYLQMAIAISDLVNDNHSEDS